MEPRSLEMGTVEARDQVSNVCSDKHQRISVVNHKLHLASSNNN